MNMASVKHRKYFLLNLILWWIYEQHTGSNFLDDYPFLKINLTRQYLQISNESRSKKLRKFTLTIMLKEWIDFTSFGLFGIYSSRLFFHIHSKTPHVVTVLWQDSDDVVTILSPTRNLVEGYKTVYLCHLDSYTVTVCNGYLVSSHVVTIQLPTRYLVDRFSHRPHGTGYPITCVFYVVTVQ